VRRLQFITLSVQNLNEVCEDFVLGVGNENIIYNIYATGPAGLDGVIIVMEHQELAVR
jgi:hypothetical protein